MLLETHVSFVGFGPRLRASVVRPGRTGQYGDASHTLDCVCSELAKGPVHYSVNLQRLFLFGVKMEYGGDKMA